MGLYTVKKLDWSSGAEFKMADAVTGMVYSVFYSSHLPVCGWKASCERDILTPEPVSLEAAKAAAEAHHLAEMERGLVKVDIESQIKRLRIWADKETQLAESEVTE